MAVRGLEAPACRHFSTGQVFSRRGRQTEVAIEGILAFIAGRIGLTGYYLGSPSSGRCRGGSALAERFSTRSS